MKCIQHDKTNPNDVAKQPHEITHGPDALRYFAQTYVLPAEQEVQQEEEEEEESEETESESPKPIYREDDISDYFTEEYERPEDRRGLIKDLDHVSKRQNAFTVIQGLLALAGLILGIFVALAQGNLDAIGGSAASGGVISLFMLAASAGLGYKTMRKGFLGIIHKKINSASGIVVLYVVIM